MKIKALAAAVLIGFTCTGALTAGTSAVTVGNNISAAIAKTGWQTENGGKYYYGTDGKVKTGFQKIGTATYYLDPNNKGKMATGWKTVGDKKYNFGGDGKMKTGSVKIGKKRHLFTDKGVFVCTLADFTWKSSKDDIAKQYETAQSYDLGNLFTSTTGGKDVASYIFDPDKGTLLMYFLSSADKTSQSAFKADLRAKGYKFVEKKTADEGTYHVYKNGSLKAMLMISDQGIGVVYLSSSASLIYDAKGEDGLRDITQKAMTAALENAGIDMSQFGDLDLSGGFGF